MDGHSPDRMCPGPQTGESKVPWLNGGNSPGRKGRQSVLKLGLVRDWRPVLDTFSPSRPPV